MGTLYTILTIKIKTVSLDSEYIIIYMTRPGSPDNFNLKTNMCVSFYYLKSTSAGREPSRTLPTTRTAVHDPLQSSSLTPDPHYHRSVFISRLFLLFIYCFRLVVYITPVSTNYRYSAICDCFPDFWPPVIPPNPPLLSVSLPRLINLHVIIISNVSKVSRPSAHKESAVVRGGGRTRLIADHDDRGGGIYML